MKSYDIAGYTFQADVIDADCLLDVANAWLAQDGVKVPYLVLADALRAWATSAGIDAQDEHTYDSDVFPKVIFVDSVEDDTGE